MTITLSLIDLAIAAILLVLALRGFRLGLSGTVLWLVTLMLTPLLTGQLIVLFGGWLPDLAPGVPPVLRQPLATVAALVVATVVSSIVAGIVLRIIRKLLWVFPGLAAFDRLAGVVANAGGGVVALGLATMVVAGFLTIDQRAELDRSTWGGEVVPRLQPLAPLALAQLFHCASPDDAPRTGVEAVLINQGVAPEAVDAGVRLLRAWQAQGPDAPLPANLDTLVPLLEAVSAASSARATDTAAAADLLIATFKAPPGTQNADMTGDAVQRVLTVLTGDPCTGMGMRRG